MKINPTNSKLYTDTGEFIKTLDCPLRRTWQSLKPNSPSSRHCDNCSQSVHDTSKMTDQELVDLMKNDPAACLMITPTQKNCTVIPVSMR